MIKDFSPSEVVTKTEYELLFYIDSSGGYAFPCDENGNVQMDKMLEPARKNYAYCMEHPEKFPYWFNHKHKNSWSYREPASGICNCGERIQLTNDFCGACECPNCGQWWNLSGDELIPPEHWEDYGDVIDYEY